MWPQTIVEQVAKASATTQTFPFFDTINVRARAFMCMCVCEMRGLDWDMGSKLVHFCFLCIHRTVKYLAR